MNYGPTTMSTDWTAADLVDRFGPIPLRRLRQEPAPGCATEQDVIDIHDREKRLFELVDGVLLEKTMGLQESFLAIYIAGLLAEYARRLDLGFVLGADGMARLRPDLVRIPDVSFISWSHFPDHLIPRMPILGFGPDLAVEVLSPGNTSQEMARKLRDYLAAGVRLVWYVNPANRTIQVFTSAEECATLGLDDTLSGDPVLPGFKMSLRELFGQLEH